MRAQHSFVLSQITRMTDRQTDGWTDRILTSRRRLHCMQRGKNYNVDNVVHVVQGSAVGLIITNIGLV